MFTTAVLTVAMLSTSYCGGGCCASRVVQQPTPVVQASPSLESRLAMYFLIPKPLQVLTYPFLAR